MKQLLISLALFSSFFAHAIPTYMTCDSNGALGLGLLTRIEFIKREQGNEYLLKVFKESSCGKNSGCRSLKKKGEAIVELFESPSKFGLLVSTKDYPYADISINFSNKTCKMKLIYSGGASLKFRGKLIDWQSVVSE